MKVYCSEQVYFVEWFNGTDRGVFGIFSNMDRAQNAIDEDKEKYPYPEYEIEYGIHPYTIDEVQE